MDSTVSQDNVLLAPRHCVSGIVGQVSDHGPSSHGRRVAVTLWQDFPYRGGEAIRHRLLFEDEEAERILSLKVETGDRIRCNLLGAMAKAYMTGEGETLKLIPFVESWANSAVLLLRNGDAQPEPEMVPEGYGGTDSEIFCEGHLMFNAERDPEGQERASECEDEFDGEFEWDSDADSEFARKFGAPLEELFSFDDPDFKAPGEEGEDSGDEPLSEKGSPAKTDSRDLIPLAQDPPSGTAGSQAARGPGSLLGAGRTSPPKER